MSSSRASPSLADRLATACDNGDLPSAKAAVADGASVNQKGKPSAWYFTLLSLAAAAYRQHHDVAVWLLSHGADPNGHKVMYYGARYSTVAILQLLIDAGGDVNLESWNVPPLFAAVDGGGEDKVRVLLAQPSLDLTIQYNGKAPEQFARHKGKPALADMVAHEVSGEGTAHFDWGTSGCADGVCGVAVAGRSRDERRWYDRCFTRYSCVCAVRRA